MCFENKVVIVTGSSSGIGAATAKLFAKQGAKLVLVGRNEAKLTKVSKEITKIGKEPLIIKADVSKLDDGKRIIKKTIEKFSKIDVLVNNAGSIKYASVLDENLLETYDEVMDTNLRSVVLLANLAAPYLIVTKGSIVNVSSVVGTMTISDKDMNGFAAYATSKAGMNHFTKMAAVELAKYGVRVNVVSPGPVQTDMLENAGKDSDWEKYAKKCALKILTQPDEVGNLIMYLASDKAASVTGSNFAIDGGIDFHF